MPDAILPERQANVQDLSSHSVPRRIERPPVLPRRAFFISTGDAFSPPPLQRHDRWGTARRLHPGVDDPAPSFVVGHPSGLVRVATVQKQTSLRVPGSRFVESEEATSGQETHHRERVQRLVHTVLLSTQVAATLRRLSEIGLNPKATLRDVLLNRDDFAEGLALRRRVRRRTHDRGEPVQFRLGQGDVVAMNAAVAGADRDDVAPCLISAR